MTYIVLANVLVFIFAYLIGSYNWAIFYSIRTEKGDIRKLGSGNAGASNMARNFNKKTGLLIFFLDAFKIVIPGLIVWVVRNYSGVTPWDNVLVQVSATGGFIGHLYPIFYKFKGGKGVASFFGFLILYNVLLFLIAFVLLYVIYKIWGYISLGSITVPTIIFALAWIPWIDHGVLSYFAIMSNFWVNPLYIFIIDLIIVLKHTSNIKRLIIGTEKGLTPQ